MNRVSATRHEAAPSSEAVQRLQRWEDWLALRSEPALEPDTPIVDPHHHLWDRGGHTYLPPQFGAELQASGHRVVSTVYVECLSRYRESGPKHLRPVGETAFIADCTDDAATPGCPAVAAGIVAHADLSLGGGVQEVLDAHAQAGRGRLRGIRFASAHDADPTIHAAYPTHPGMLREAQVHAGARCLARTGLSFDAWLYFHQLGDLLVLARACPELTIVIDHCGAPIGLGRYADLREEVFTAWRAALQPFGALPHVSLKFGGLAMPLAGFGWRKRERPPASDAMAEAWQPYFDACLETFGPGRCMFESNFPVDRNGCTYASLWNAFKRLAAPLSPDERQALLSGTAKRVYRI